MIFWDASAAAKRYFPELGSDRVAELFGRPEPRCSLILLLCELVSAINRRLCEGDLSRGRYRTVRDQLEADARAIEIIPVDADLIATSVRLLDSHPLKALDSLYLAGALNLRQDAKEPMLFVSADRQLLRAARAEGLKTLDPEQA